MPHPAMVAFYLAFFVAGWFLGAVRAQQRPRSRKVGYRTGSEGAEQPGGPQRATGTLIGLHVPLTARGKE